MGEVRPFLIDSRHLLHRYHHYPSRVLAVTWKPLCYLNSSKLRGLNNGKSEGERGGNRSVTGSGVSLPQLFNWRVTGKGRADYQGVNIMTWLRNHVRRSRVFFFGMGACQSSPSLDELRTHIAASYEIPQWVRGPIEYFSKDAEANGHVAARGIRTVIFRQRARDLSREASLRLRQPYLQFLLLWRRFDRARNGRSFDQTATRSEHRH